MTRWRLMATIGALCILFLGDRILASILDEIMMSSHARYSVVYGQDQQSDVLIIGDSRGSACCYTPAMRRKLGISCLNISDNYLGVGVVEALFLDYLDHHPPPKILVLEISNLSTNTWGSLTNLKPYWHHSQRLTELAQEHAPRELSASRVSNIYRFNSEMFLRVLYYTGRTDQTWANPKTVGEDFVFSVTQSQPERMNEPRAERIVALKRILEEASRRGIEVRLFYSPILPAYRQKIENLESWKSLVQDSLGPEVPIWDYSDSIAENEAFADRVHTNVKGAELLLDLMIEQGLFASVAEAQRLSLTNVEPVSVAREQGDQRPLLPQ